MYLPYDPAVILLGIYSNELRTYICTKTCTLMFLVTFLIKTCLFIKLIFIVVLLINLCQNLGAVEMSFSFEVERMIYQLNGILFIVKKKSGKPWKEP